MTIKNISISVLIDSAGVTAAPIDAWRLTRASSNPDCISRLQDEFADSENEMLQNIWEDLQKKVRVQYSRVDMNGQKVIVNVKAGSAFWKDVAQAQHSGQPLEYLKKNGYGIEKYA